MPKHNTLRQKPYYTLHRYKAAAVAIAADDAVLSDFRADNARGDLDCAGWDTIAGFVKLAGGTSIVLQLTELVKYRDKDGIEKEELIEVGAPTVALSDGDAFSFTVNQGRVLLRIDSPIGNITEAKVFASGAQANDIEHRGGARRYA